MIKGAVTGEAIAADWCGTSNTGSVVLTGINPEAAAEGTLDKLNDLAAKLKSGELHVFDTTTFTVTVTADKNVNATNTNGLVYLLADDRGLQAVSIVDNDRNVEFLRYLAHFDNVVWRSWSKNRSGGNNT